MSRTLLLALAITMLLLGYTIVNLGQLQVKSSSTVQPLYSGLAFPVSFTFLHDGRIFYNEKNTGNIKVILSNGTIIPTPFATVGPLPPGVGGTEEGLLGIALDPNFNANSYVYVYWTYWNGTYKHAKITRFTAVGNTGTNNMTIFDLTDPNPNQLDPTNHNGGYIKFGPDGKLYVEVGDFCSWDCLGNPLAQQLTTYAGKILRMNPNGTVPSDNPFASSLVYAYGYRNGVGMDFSPSGKLIATMAGPNCCDRVFFVNAGANFGWPNCGTDAQQTCSTPPYTASIFQTGPVVTPTGIAYSLNPGILYFGEFNTGNLMQLVLTPSGTLAQVSTIASGPGGVVAVERAPDGRIWFSTPSTIYRLTPPPLILSLTLLSPADGTVLDHTLANLQVRGTLAGGNVPEINVTVNVNGAKICNGLSDGAGLFGCNFQATLQGIFYWNATVAGTNSSSVKAYFILGLVQPIQLISGWNLFSVPLVPADMKLADIFTAQITSEALRIVWSFQHGAWKFNNGGNSGTLTAIQDGYGYWVYLTQPSTLYVTAGILSASNPNQ